MFLDQECCRYALKITWHSTMERIKIKYSEILKSQLSNTAKNGGIATEGPDNADPEALGINNGNYIEDPTMSNDAELEEDSDSEYDDNEENNGKCSRFCILTLAIIFFPIILFVRFAKYIWYYKLHSPIFKFFWYLLSHVAFVVMFSYFMLFDLKPDRYSICEILVWCWVVTMCLEEIRQLYDSGGLNLWLRVVSYLTNAWNVYDLVGYVLFLVSFILRLTISKSQLYWVTVFYVLCLIMFTLRLLQYFSVIEYFGPKIGILLRMFKDTIGYILVFGLFLITYGVATQVLQYPNTGPVYHVLFNIAYYPYFTIFGQFDLLQDQVYKCTSNDTLVSFEAGIPRCSWLAEMLSAAYAFVVCIMLVNLLIATYSATHESVEQNANALWLSYRIDIITEYSKKPMLPPPLNALGLLYRLLQSLRVRGKFESGDYLKLTFEEECHENLVELEKQSCSRVLRKHCSKQKDSDSMVNEFFNDNQKLKAVIKEILLQLQGDKDQIVKM